jgi:hypothetical protein
VPAPPPPATPHQHVPIDGPADLDALRDGWSGVLRRLEPVMRVALDPSEPAVLNGSALIVNVRGSMLAVASRYSEALGHAIAAECGVRVSPSFAAAATIDRPEPVNGSLDDEHELEPPVGGEALAARLLNEFDAHEEQD